MHHWENDKIDYTYLNNFFNDFKEVLEKNNLLTNTTIRDYLNILTNKDQLEHFKRVLITLNNFEFGNRQLKYFIDTTINFKANYQNTTIEYILTYNNGQANVEIFNHEIPTLIEGNILYLDSPAILDFDILKSENYLDKFYLTNKIYHNDYLIRCINDKKDSKKNINMYDDLLNKKQLYFQKKLSELIKGNFEFDENSEIIFSTNDKKFEVQNVASGYKQIGILQLLLKNDYLKNNSFLIIDEPEVNLHPHLQVNLLKY